MSTWTYISGQLLLEAVGVWFMNDFGFTLGNIPVTHFFYTCYIFIRDHFLASVTASLKVFIINKRHTKPNAAHTTVHTSGAQMIYTAILDILKDSWGVTLGGLFLSRLWPDTGVLMWLWAFRCSSSARHHPNKQFPSILSSSLTDQLHLHLLQS